MDNINILMKNGFMSDYLECSTDITTVPSLQNLKDTDVVQIWDEVSAHIEKFMSQSKGISMPGFGTFSFVQKKLDVGNNKFLLIQRPVFVVAEKFAQTHGLSCNKYPVAGNIPVHSLNYSAVANETAFSRDNIELCVRHVLQLLNKSVQSKKNVEFTFTGIGKLIIRNNRVKMKFFKEFVNAYDQSGKAMAQMQNRPNTADSVMSRNQSARPPSRNTCFLPRINSRAGNEVDLNRKTNMDEIKEECDEELNASLNGEANATNKKTARQQQKQQQDEINATTTTTNNNNNSNVYRIPLPVATIFSSSEETNEHGEACSSDTTNSCKGANDYMISTSDNAAKAVANTTNTEKIIDDLKKRAARSNATIAGVAKSADAAPECSNGSSHSVHFRKESSQSLTRPCSKSLVENLVTNSSGSGISGVGGGGGGASNKTCTHHNAGQELCYLCHQRCRRNVPVYLHDEVRRKEEEESKLLSQYQQMKDLEKQLSDQEKRNIQRSDRAKMDAFNLGIMEALKAKKAERPKTSDMSRSFVFRRRVRTPPKAQKQKDLADYLRYQIEDKRREVNQIKNEMNYFEKLEQKQLAEDLAARREHYIKEKARKQQDLKGTLDFQVKNKPAEIPKVLPDAEVFGEHDAKNEKLAEQRRREIEAFHFHKDLIEQKKREKLLRHMREQEIDAENIERVKEEYRIDRANRYMRMLEMRKTLEKDWVEAHLEKKERDEDEKLFRKSHAGELVHEQCDKYRRCAQCKRDTKNCGESNIWTDTRYLPGTRLMI